MSLRVDSQEYKLYVAETTYLDDSQIHAFQEPFLNYYESEFGQFHYKQKLRFDQFRYDNLQMHADLGNDIQPLLHMPFTHDHVVRPMLSYQIRSGEHSELSPESIRLLRQAAYFHDTGENEHPSLVDVCGGIVGDIAFDIKNSQSLEDKQKTALLERKIREFFYEKHLRHMSDDELIALEEIVGDDTPDSYEKQFFDTAEHLGYLGTAMKAAEIALAHAHEFADGPSLRISQLGRLAVQVGNHWFESLSNVTSDYPHIRDKLQSYESTIAAVNTKIKPSISI